MKHELPTLPYAYDALEPYIDARTMELHHSKHHATYVAKLNEALQDHPDLQEQSLEELLKHLDSVPDMIRAAVRNHGGGHHNHSLFWKLMKPQGGGEAKGALGEAIASTFGDFAKFKEEFTNSAATLFGSGWAWLVKDESERLSVIKTPNQESPIMMKMKPILCIDVWEHAYYLKYQNRRPEYVEAWWNVVNWEEAEKNFNTV